MVVKGAPRVIHPFQNRAFFQAVLEETSLERRLRHVLELVREQTHVLSIASKINSEVEGKLHNRQREFYLRQQLKAIRSELGEEVRLDEGFSRRPALVRVFILFCVYGVMEWVTYGEVCCLPFFVFCFAFFSVQFAAVYYVVISSC